MRYNTAENIQHYFDPPTVYYTLIITVLLPLPFNNTTDNDNITAGTSSVSLAQ